MLNAIFATDESLGFGCEGRLPWGRVPQDLQFFKKQTCNSIIIMGRKTHESLPTLPYRVPIVITSNKEYEVLNGTTLSPRILPHLGAFSKTDLVSRPLFVIGGAALLTKEVLEQCDNIYWTTIKGTFPADTYLDVESAEYIRNNTESEVLEEHPNCIIRRYFREQ